MQQERTYGLLGDIHYYVEPELDPDDGHYQWAVVVLLGGEHEELAGWYWYDDNEIVVQALDPFEPAELQLDRSDRSITGDGPPTYEVAADEQAAVARILRGWDDVEIVEEP